MNTPSLLTVIDVNHFDKSAQTEFYIRYRLPLIRWLIKSYQLNLVEATELTQETFVIFIEKALAQTLPKFDSESNIKTYLFAIAKNKVREKFREKEKVGQLFGQIPDEVEIADTPIQEQLQQQIQIAMKSFRKLGEKCQKLLQMAVMTKTPMNEIAETLNYSNAQTAKNLKYKCLQRLRKFYHQTT